MHEKMVVSFSVHHGLWVVSAVFCVIQYFTYGRYIPGNQVAKVGPVRLVQKNNVELSQNRFPNGQSDFPVFFYPSILQHRCWGGVVLWLRQLKEL